jgi:aspartate ammonia-lyase
VNTPDGYRDTVIRTLRSLTALDLVPANNSFEALQSLSQMGAFSGSLKELSLELIRIANDLRLMNSGPVSGLSEISLPPVQPGSSIMPGKFNPVMAECADMIGFRIVGNDTTVSMAVQAGQFEMNVMAPLIVYTILESVSLLTRFLPVFTLQCIDGIVAHEERLMADAGTNPALATLLTPKIGYLRAAELAHESMVQQRPVRDLAIEKGILSEDEAAKLFDLNRIARNRYR